MNALDFMKNAKGRIVGSGDLTVHQIAEAQAMGRFFVDADTGLGWADLPWELTADKDKAREQAI